MTNPPPPDDFVFFPGVNHPQGREQLFTDMWKGMVRHLVDGSDNPVLAYAVEKTQRILTEETMKRVSPEIIQEWHDAFDEFEAMEPEDQEVWIDKVVTTYPDMADLPDPEGYNEIH